MNGIRNILFSIFAVMLTAVLFVGCTPSGPKALLQGEDLLKKNRPREAVKKMEKAVKYMPNSDVAWNFLGVAYHRANELDKALGAYQRAAALNPTLSVLIYNRGCLNLDKRNYDQAIQSLTQYINNNNSNFVPAWEKLGYAYLAIQQTNEASQCFDRVLKLDPKNAKVANTLGLIELGRNQPEHALAFFQYSAAVDTNYAAPHLNTAVLYQRAGGATNIQTAIRYYDDYLVRSPESSLAEKVRNQVLVLDSRLRFNVPAEVVAQARTEVKTEASAGAPVETVTNIVQTVGIPVPIPTNQVAQVEPKLVEEQPAESETRVAEVTPEPASETITTATNRVIITKLSPEPEVVTVSEQVVVTPSEPAVEISAVAGVPEEVSVTDLTEETSVPQTMTQEIEQLKVDIPQTGTNHVSTEKPVIVQVEPIPTKSEVVPQKEPVVIVKKEVEPEKKRGFFSRVFGKSDSDQEPVRTTSVTTGRANASASVRPEPPVIAPVAAEPADALAEQEAQKSAREAIALRVYEPYTYHNPPKPISGTWDEEANTFFHRAYRAHQEKDYPTAIEYYLKTIQKDPSHFDSHFNLGLVYYGSGDLSSSLLEFENALAIMPDSWEGRYNFALALDKAGHPSDALVELKRVTRLNEKHANSWLQMGNIYQGRFGDVENAYQCFKKFIELAPNHPYAAATMRWLDQNADKVKVK